MQRKLTLSSVRFGYPNQWGVGPFSLSLNTGLTLLLGKNASGKTTLLRGLAGLLRLQEGDLFFNDKNLVSFDRKTFTQQIGYLQQQPPLPIGITAHELLSFGQLPFVKRIWEDPLPASLFLSLLQDLEIPCSLSDLVEKLSGGTRQLLHIARLLLQAPSLYLLDEPLEGIDLYHQKLVMKRLQKEMIERKAIILMSTHHLTYPLKVADRILMLDQGALIGDEDPRNFKLDFLEEHRDREPMGL
ncbi:MAG TPA: ABC transporter ATP-binding protein [Bdellovibrionota bacterium]|nr:ABC transporter ATP-binding protein [Bdellovibrionota bacterium]